GNLGVVDAGHPIGAGAPVTAADEVPVRALAHQTQGRNAVEVFSRAIAQPNHELLPDGAMKLREEWVSSAVECPRTEVDVDALAGELRTLASGRRDGG